MTQHPSRRRHYRSLVPDIRMPALFDRRGAQLAATVYQLEQSQWWAPEALWQAQAKQLTCLLEHAQRHVPYYRERLAGLKLSADPASLLVRWRQIPLLTRSDINAAGERLFTTAPLAGHGRQRNILTSGSTGKPLHARSNELVDHFYRAIVMRDQYWHKRDFTQKLAAIRPDREKTLSGIQKDSWGPPAQRLHACGESVLLHSSADISAQSDWLLEQDPVYLLSMPSNLAALANEFQRRGARLPKLRQLMSYAETLKPELRRKLQEAFGVPIIDIYTSVEVGYIALQCPDFEHFHVQSEVAMVEVLDDQGNHCVPGQVGRVVVTPLHNFSSPLIRYENGDYAEMGEPCACGRGLPVINRILGRERNLITLPDGSQHWPYLNLGYWSEIVPVTQGQVVQKTVHDLEVRLVVERALTLAEEAALSKFLSGQLRHDFNYEFTYHESLKRGRSGKFEDFISELDR